MRTGLAYEEMVGRWLTTLHNRRVVHGQWFTYSHGRGHANVCQPDFIILPTHHKYPRLLVIEVKLVGHRSAAEKMLDLYMPVVTAALVKGDPRLVRGVFFFIRFTDLLG